MVEPVLKEGWTVWMDNLYNSPCLARTLKAAQDRLCWYTETEPKKYSSKSGRQGTEKKVK
jgi:hypothetical protein